MCANWVNGFCTLYGMRCRCDDENEMLDCEDYEEDED